MKGMHVATFTAAALAVFATTPAPAHHSFAAVYDGSKTVTLEGTVTLFRFVNPHALLALDVTDATGTVRQWTVEFDGRLNLTVAGWTESSITAGEHVKVSGNPERSGGPNIFFQRLVRANGAELLRPAIQRTNSIEEDRRRRALERAPPESR